MLLLLFLASSDSMYRSKRDRRPARARRRGRQILDVRVETEEGSSTRPWRRHNHDIEIPQKTRVQLLHDIDIVGLRKLPRPFALKPPRSKPEPIKILARSR